ncbi:MAG: caspase family protein, partial [Rhodospirillales bacterium]|nr:caspase family protein [Rhodospirillales bacterium]
PDTPQLINIVTDITSIKQAISKKSGSSLKTSISALRATLKKEAGFASFEAQRVTNRQQQRQAAEKRAERARLIAINQARGRINNLASFLKREVAINLVSQPKISQGLIPIVASLDKSKSTDDLTFLRKLEGKAEAALKKYKLISKYAEVQRTIASLRKTKEKKVASVKEKAVASIPEASETRPAQQPYRSKYGDLDFGQYHALIIGNNNYKNIPKLQTAQQDARVLANTLEKSFGFKVQLLLDATRKDIIEAFDKYSRKLRKSDNFLIYYAGHGWLDKGQAEGFWLPVDAERDSRFAWIANSTITRTLRGLSAKHVMVVADSCYSGTLTRGLRVELTPGDYIRKVVPKRARMVISSGGLEPVEDKGKGGHSPFASALLSTLTDTNDVITATDLFKKIQRPVELSADQTPVFADIRKAGHEGGDFIFVRKR